MSWNISDEKAQDGRVAVITGANIGLGYETALALAGKGAELVLACRNLAKADHAKAEIISRHPTATISCMQLDLTSLASVKQFVEAYTSTYERLDLLINNAGIMMPPYSLTEDGFESQLGANYLGHFALTGLLLPTIKKTTNARIISLASLAHNWSDIQFSDINFSKKYSARKAYGQSKFACLMFAYELQRRLTKHNYHAISVAAHPGASQSNLSQHMPKVLQWLAPLVCQSTADGAEPTLYAALKESLNGGEYIGPSGFQQARGKPKVVGSNHASKNINDAAKLWRISEELTNIRYLD